MAERGTLHKNKLEDFKVWLECTGWTLELCKGYYEVIRARKGKRLVLIFDNNNTAHLSYAPTAHDVVMSFIRSRKESRAICNQFVTGSPSGVPVGLINSIKKEGDTDV